MTSPTIVKFDRNGPDGAGLEEWFKIDRNDLVSGEPVQKVHIYHENESTGCLTGVWDCTAMTMKPGAYPDNEFMLLLEGSLEFALGDGAKVVVNAGEAFVIPKGLRCQWIQPGYVRKFFMIFSNPGGAGPEDAQSLGIIKLQSAGPASGFPAMTIEDTSEFRGAIPIQHDHVYYEDPTGQMQVGLWDSTPFETALAPFSRNELMHLLDGAVTLTDSEGREHRFSAGDTFYIPQGLECSWRSEVYVRKFYSIFQPLDANVPAR